MKHPGTARPPAVRSQGCLAPRLRCARPGSRGRSARPAGRRRWPPATAAPPAGRARRLPKAPASPCRVADLARRSRGGLAGGDGLAEPPHLPQGVPRGCSTPWLRRAGRGSRAYRAAAFRHAAMASGEPPGPPAGRARGCPVPRLRHAGRRVSRTIWAASCRSRDGFLESPDLPRAVPRLLSAVLLPAGRRLGVVDLGGVRQAVMASGTAAPPPGRPRGC